MIVLMMALRSSIPIPFPNARWAFVCCVVGTFWTSPADATFSILAVDKTTGVIGGAAASCVGTYLSLSEVIAVDPNVGGVIAQALYWPQGRDRILEELRAGASPAASIQAAIDPDFDSVTKNAGPEHRQYAALTLGGNVATFTGASTLTFAGDRSGATDRFVYSIQGNTLEGQAVLDSLEQGFLSSDGGVGLRLIAALRAVAESGRGDSRCSPLTADAAYFELHVPGEEPFRAEIVTPAGDATTALVLDAAPLLPTEPEVMPIDDEMAPVENAESSASPRASIAGCRYSPGKSSSWGMGLFALLGLGFQRRGRRKPPPRHVRCLPK